MQSFLDDVIAELWQEHGSFERTVFILPSKRAGTFLRQAIARTANSTLFAPEIYSIEAFVESISQLRYASNTQQIFELYQCFIAANTDGNQDFFSFTKWAQTLLQDFNEVDRYLTDAKALFSNLYDIQKIEHWSPNNPKTKMMEEYQKFWGGLYPLYSSFNDSLLKQGLGHQGLVYRRAVDLLPDYVASNNDKNYVFIGFNALNRAETHIIQELLDHGNAAIFWDLDASFLDDVEHDAGFFIRKHRHTWNFLKQNGLKGISNHFESPKNIEIIGVPKNVSQAKYVGTLLNELASGNETVVKNSAVVLGDEALLNPILNAIPRQIGQVNITMGYPLKDIPLASFFHQFIDLYLREDNQGWFYKFLLSFLSHPYCGIVLDDGSKFKVTTIINTIKAKNWTYIDFPKLSTTMTGRQLNLLFFAQRPTPTDFIRKCLDIILELKSKLEKSGNSLDLEYLYRFYTLFNQLHDFVERYDFIDDLKSLQSLLSELVSSESLDFRGEPLEGLQIMGMLESRNLDFDTVIITSVNEGILPSGKTNNSFIPFDVKRNFGLPTYKEKDAVYTYHFYRLLQRAKNVYILYNTEPDVLEGGERSRLISQLLTDSRLSDNISEMVVAPNIEPTKNALEQIDKDGSLIERIKEYAARGFSPTSLTDYIRNPIDFYKKSLLGISDASEVEETIAANTFGTVVHDSLEEIYTPFIGKVLTDRDLLSGKKLIPSVVKSHFSKSYAGGDLSFGKNLIAYNVIVRYIENFIDLEIKEVQRHQIKVLALEKKLEIQLDIPELNFPVVLKGKLDRIDEKDGITRIIDYKTGKVEAKNVAITDWGDIISEYDQSKAFQLLCYAKMYAQEQPFEAVEAGIITFKKLSAGLMSFGTKPSRRSRSINKTITPETIAEFTEQLKKLIAEICDPNVSFVEKEV